MCHQYSEYISKQFNFLINSIKLPFDYMHILISVLGSAPRPHHVDPVPELPLPVHFNRPLEKVLRVKRNNHLIINQGGTLRYLITGLVHEEAVGLEDLEGGLVCEGH
jgi:hypothetical protein